MRAVILSSLLSLSPAILVATARESGANWQARQNHALEARQDPAGVADDAAVSTSLPASNPVAAPTPVNSGLVIAPPATTPVGSVSAPGVAPTTYSFSLQATNPTAVPLSMITAAQSSFPTRPLASTATAGAKPSFIPGAPDLPDASLLLPINYPVMDAPPPTDSPEVQQWKQDVANSGITIPDFAPTIPGGCAFNQAIATDPNRCWWTCTGCTRDADITQCPKPMQWGLTYDDGPGFYTSNLLQYLDEKKLKSTFFVVGSRAIQFPRILQTQYLGEHQIAVHTWSHTPLTTQTNDQIIAELGWTKKIIKDALGVTPNMMRPPFGDIDDRVRAISIAMGLTPVIWTRTSPVSTFDTDDFNIHNGVTPVSKVLQNWQNILSSAQGLDHGFIVLEHDLFQESVEVATGYILPDALAHNPPFSIQPVVQCLGRSMGDAYIETNNNKTNPPPGTSGGSNAQDGDSDSGFAGRQFELQMNPTTLGGMIIGISGFAVGFLAMLRV
ncbi:chitin deacetylase [Coprinopsis cinerea okayama7|uniref:chitin deacetylase n=1 Tax=Coprinopsis cinerea (strain Okayama-7 / 130 / ATCC MYA-4618 / FGSC 9003) TaxID=240176 RepID=A8N190_COPC7|nr:chitin deacetylase [Coprinopsis cinerea okayama7\|eukprot:XP_001828639.2 chitin deacetylase [Coprinopsis cinerea okayama7\